MKKLLCCIMVIVLTLSIVGCSSPSNELDPDSAATDRQSPGKETLNVIISADPGSLDPHDTTGNPHHQVTRQIYETLVVRGGDDGELQPWLAEDWEYENDTTLVMHIREGVYFHNGDELKASDVLFSLRRMKDDNTTASMQVDMIDFDKSSVADDYTVKIVTFEPSPMLLGQLENPLSCIISEKVYTEAEGDFNTTSIGTGPYKLVEYLSGDKITMVANDQYWIEDQPRIKNLTFRIITDSSSRAIEAESGGADIVYDIGANDVDRVAETKGVSLVREIGTNTQFITLNAANSLLSDIRVRQAVFYALDRSQIADIAFGTFGMEATGIISPGIEGRIDLTDDFVERDIEKAKNLLSDAGYPDGIELEIVAPNSDPVRMDIAESAQAQLADAGIILKINYKEYNTWISDMISGDAVMGVYGFSASTGEAGRVLMRWMPEYSEALIFGWYDEEYIAICTKALQTIDDGERNELFAECQKMLMDACVVFPVWHKEINAAIQDDVGGFEMQTSYEHHYLQTVYFK